MNAGQKAGHIIFENCPEAGSGLEGGSMGLLIDFYIFPVGEGESVSVYVSRAVKRIERSGLAFKVGPMGTAIEGEWDEVMALAKGCLEEMAQDCHRVYFTIKGDYRKGPSGRIESKVRSVQNR